MKRALLSMAAVIGVLAGMTGVAGAGVGSAESIDLSFYVSDPAGNAAAISNGLGAELYIGGSLAQVPCVVNPNTTVDSFSSAAFFACVGNLGVTYTVGVTGVPANFYVSGVSCDVLLPEIIEDGGAQFTLDGPADCSISIDPMPRIYIDKIVVGGSLTPEDFVLEVFENGAPVATLVDTSDQTCGTVPGPANTSCANTQLPPGTYEVGERTELGYVPSVLFCVPISLGGFGEIIDGSPSFSHGVRGNDTICEIENVYYEQSVTADLVIVNDDGGTAGVADFAIEVYHDGILVDSGVDPELGEGNSSLQLTLPVGEYVFGVAGPDGYTATAAVTVVTVAPPIDEIIDGGSADFSLTPLLSAEGVITVDDPVTTTTAAPTTVAPTTAAPTTVAPTTVAPTTVAPTTAAPTTQAPTSSIGPETAPVLPETGGDNSGVLALLALALVALGGTVMFATRRS